MNSELEIELVAVVFRSNRDVEVIKKESITGMYYGCIQIET